MTTGTIYDLGFALTEKKLGPQSRLHLNHDGWNALAADHAVVAKVDVGDGMVPATKTAVLALAGALGLGKPYALRCPIDLLETNVNYWLRAGNIGLKLLIRKDTAVSCVPLATQLVDIAALTKYATIGLEATIPGTYSGSMQIDSNELLQYRVVSTFPVAVQPVDDQWRLGVVISASLIGKGPVTIHPLAEREEGGAAASISGEDAWTASLDLTQWATMSAGRGVKVAQSWMKDAAELVEHPAIPGEHTTAEEELTDLLMHGLQELPMPAKARSAVMDEWVEQEYVGSTAYDVLAAIAAAADTAGLTNAERLKVEHAAGAFPAAHRARCAACRRLGG